MGAKCEPEADGSYRCDYGPFDNRYYKFEVRVTVTAAIIAMVGSYSLVIWYGKNRMPFFVQGICLCAIFGTLCVYFVETMASREYPEFRGKAFYGGEQWFHLVYPYRAVSGFLSSLAHWLFAA